MRPTSLTSLLPVVVACWLVPGAAEASTILYSQPSSSLATTGAWASQNDIGGFGNYATAYDDFTLGVDASIEDVHWQGTYFPDHTGTITGFTVGFYSDNAGQPGTLLISESFAGTAGETFIGNAVFGPAYSYSTLLTSPFAITAGATYWLSIVADLTYPPQWGWNNVAGGTSVQDFLGERFVRDNSLVYDLTGTAVPEPASLTLLGLGLAGIGARHRRRKAR